ncbi:MAG: DUF4838 domain-containing protein [Eubacteriales bacterium]
MNGFNQFIFSIKGFILTFFSVFTFLSAPLFPLLPSFVPKPEEPVIYTGPVMTLADKGTTDYVIVIADAPYQTVAKAAEVLVDYTNRVTGVSISIVHAGSYSTGKKIVISNTAADLDFIDGNPGAIDASLGKEGFLIKTNDQNIYIIGGSRGILYGVYDFLENYLGCHWYAKTCIVVPDTKTVKIPIDIDINETPAIGYRETDWLSPIDPEYCVANRINGNRRYISPEMGGSEGYTGGFGHTFGVFLPAATYFETDPEIFAISSVDGKRSPAQLCLTNPRTLQLMCQKIDELMAANPDANLISLTQNDGLVYCVCPNCKAIDDAQGSQSGTMISFLNAVADYTKDKYPKLMLDTFAYTYTRKPPKTLIARDNVVVRLCSIECCYAHPISDPTCPRNALFVKDIQDWSKVCKHLSIWDYTTNYSHLNGPFTNFGVLQPNMQFFLENHAIGVYEEGNYFAYESNSEFADLRSYLLAKLMWDPNLDYSAEMNGFLKGYYGDGWQYIREYIDMTIAKTGNNNLHTTIGTEMDDRALLNLKPNEIDYINELWVKAKEKAQDKTHLDNVRRSELSWRYWKANNRFSEYSIAGNPLGWYDENKKLYADFKEFGIKRIREARLMGDNPALWQIPRLWLPS